MSGSQVALLAEIENSVSFRSVIDSLAPAADALPRAADLDAALASSGLSCRHLALQATARPGSVPVVADKTRPVSA